MLAHGLHQSRMSGIISTASACLAFGKDMIRLANGGVGMPSSFSERPDTKTLQSFWSKCSRLSNVAQNASASSCQSELKVPSLCLGKGGLRGNS